MRNKRRAVLAGISIGAMVMAGVAFANREAIEVEWHIWRLGSKDMKVAYQSAEALRGRVPLRALEPLFAASWNDMGTGGVPENANAEARHDYYDRILRVTHESIRTVRFENIYNPIHRCILELGASAVPFLRSRLISCEIYVCLRACYLLRGLEHEAADAVDALWNLARRHDSVYLRTEAIWTLGAIGSASQEILPQMKRLLETSQMTDDRIWLQTLTEAIEKIEGDFD